MPDRLTIAVEGLSLRGRCGVTAEERALGQTLVFDLRLVPAECPGAVTDALEDTVNYGDVVRAVTATVAEGEFHLLERLATVVADRLWSAALDELVVRVRKIDPPVPAPTEAAAVELVRRR
ncbi:MAG: dihydroneopterin aldolase [Actinomycetota bacterium]|nr:MAG: dihydroneopterin aldolase [Actinomycetota bacterium]